MPDVNRIETPAFPSRPETPAALAPLPSFIAPASLPLPQVCRIVRHLVAELVMMTADRASFRRDRRRMLCHVRQIAMYLCHVSLSIPQGDIGDAFGRDRSTVGHACSVVEDRRDDAAFDDLVATAERMVATVFGCREVARHD